MSNRKLCGLWGAHVNISKFNNYGNCPCLDCPGLHCVDCPTFEQLAEEKATVVFTNAKTRCGLCQTYECKTR